MGVYSKSEFCEPCYVSCDGSAFIVIQITRIFRGSDDGVYKWFADYKMTENKNINLRDCDKIFSGCGSEAAINAAFAAAGNEFSQWLEKELGPETTNQNYRPGLVKKSKCLSCDVDIRVGIEIQFTSVTVVYDQLADICPPCATEVVVNPSSVKITIGPYSV